MAKIAQPKNPGCEHDPTVEMRHRNGVYEFRKVCSKCGAGLTAWSE